MRWNTLNIKIASEPWEFDEIHKLNYQTFVEEIPQHKRNNKKILVDKYHEQNTYIICLKGESLNGMLALRDKRPFSLDIKLGNLSSYLPKYNSILEYRLLTVRKEYRNSEVFAGLLKKAFHISIRGGYDFAVISAATRRMRLYNHLGFEPFGPLVGTAEAPYQPMYIDLDRAKKLKEKSRVLQ